MFSTAARKQHLDTDRQSQLCHQMHLANGPPAAYHTTRLTPDVKSVCGWIWHDFFV